ncbi:MULTISPECIES: hypothetical protein [Bacillaceae]|uniref:hypothetical protein n=1 Tax=Bacillaceae TaxID=186817 RepID=UPI000B13C2C9|nr:hypothetical protein [Bacillus sp. SD075]MBO1000278.1 hypothetical protein [Bacillus sp. SD075]MEE3956018.1 hypothetical protein [Peribacillus frigoritolerans]
MYQYYATEWELLFMAKINPVSASLRLDIRVLEITWKTARYYYATEPDLLFDLF